MPCSGGAQRREFLCLATSIAICAGCTSANSDQERNAGTTRSDGEVMTGQQTEKPIECQDSMSMVRFTITNRSSGTRVNTAQISDSQEPLAVAGTIWGRNGCMSAQLDHCRRNDDNSSVELAIETVNQQDNQDPCSQSTVEIEYEVELNHPESLSHIIIEHQNGLTTDRVLEYTL